MLGNEEQTERGGREEEAEGRFYVVLSVVHSHVEDFAGFQMFG